MRCECVSAPATQILSTEPRSPSTPPNDARAYSTLLGEPTVPRLPRKMQAQKPWAQGRGKCVRGKCVRGKCVSGKCVRGKCVGGKCVRGLEEEKGGGGRGRRSGYSPKNKNQTRQCGEKREINRKNGNLATKIAIESDHVDPFGWLMYLLKLCVSRVYCQFTKRYRGMILVVAGSLITWNRWIQLESTR